MCMCISVRVVGGGGEGMGREEWVFQRFIFSGIILSRNEVATITVNTLRCLSFLPVSLLT